MTGEAIRSGPARPSCGSGLPPAARGRAHRL